MFTPPPSPMPRNFGAAVDNSARSADTPRSEELLSPSSGWSPASSSRSPSPSPSTSAISSAVTPGSKSPRSTTFAFQHAASQPLQAVSLAMPPPPRSSRPSVAKHSRNSTVSVLASDRAALASHVAASDKKAQGRVLKAFAIGVPLLLVAATLLAQRWRNPIIETLHVVDAQRQQVWKRQDTPGGNSLTSVSSTATSTAATPTTTGTRLGDVPPAPADDAQVVLPTPFPQPFDSSISNNFTSTSCSSFFTNFKSSRDFRSCRSFGMLHANSREWFSSAQQAVPTANKDGGIDYMNRLVWGTCHTSTDRQTCEGTMATLDEQIRRDCKQELKDKNAVAVAALVGFANWPLYRDLGCLINARTGGYCYLDALNSATADDTYLYSLPLGVDIATYNPTCSRCAQQVLAVLQQYTGNSSLPIAKTYPPVREKTAPVCGSDYALEPLASSSVAFGPSLAFFFMVTLVALFAL